MGIQLFAYFSFGADTVFGNTAFECAACNFCPCKPLCLVDFCRSFKLFNLFAAVVCCLSFHYKRLDSSSGGDRIFEHDKFGAFSHPCGILQLHFKADIGFVGAVQVDGIIIADPREGLRQVRTDGFFEHRAEHIFGNVEHIIAGDKAHFNIDLRELRLAVAARVFITVAAGNLKIAVKTGDHQYLLVQLRGLRQRIELARIEAGRHQIVARALRRRFNKGRRFNFQEVPRCEVLPHRERNL